MATGREREEVADDLLQLAQIEPQDVDQAMVHFAALGCDLLQGYYLAKPAKPFIAPAGFEGEDD